MYGGEHHAGITHAEGQGQGGHRLHTDITGTDKADNNGKCGTGKANGYSGNQPCQKWQESYDQLNRDTGNGKFSASQGNKP